MDGDAEKISRLLEAGCRKPRMLAGAPESMQEILQGRGFEPPNPLRDGLLKPAPLAAWLPLR